MITLNLDDTILPHYVSHDLLDLRFYLPQKSGAPLEVIVEIRDINYPLLPHIYTIGFGPPDGLGNFRDDMSVNHLNHSTVFSTVMAIATAFFVTLPITFIGIGRL